MDFKRLAAALCLVVASGTASAGFANLRAPMQFSSSANATVGNVGRYNPAANGSNWVNSQSMSTAVINVGGVPINVPVQFRLAANAGSTILGAVRMTPAGYVGTAIGAWLIGQGLQYLAEKGQWGKPGQVTDCLGYNGGSGSAMADCTAQGAIDKAMEALNRAYPNTRFELQGLRYDAAGNVIGFTAKRIWRFNEQDYDEGTHPHDLRREQIKEVVPGSQDVTEAEWDAIGNQPIPQTVLDKWDQPLPIQIPVINPDYIGNPQPLRVPLGLPKPAPAPAPGGTPQPQPFNQPIIEIVPAPLPNQPFRVDLQPKEIPVPDAGGLQAPKPKAEDDPDGVPIPWPDSVPLPRDEGIGGQPGTPTEIKIETCGLPGKPPCKIDEAGTPSDWDETAPRKAIDDALKDVRAISTDPEKFFPKLPTLQWAFSFPTGCSPIALPAFAPYFTSIDVCQHQSVFHDLMSFVWVTGSLLGAFSLFMRDTLATH